MNELDLQYIRLYPSLRKWHTEMKEILMKTLTDFAAMTLEAQQNMHSNMLATCHDLGIVPHTQGAVDITSVEHGQNVLATLHNQIEEFQSQKNSGTESQKGVAEDPKSGQNVTKPARAKKKAVAKKAATSKKAEASAPAEKPEEKTVAKKAVKKAKAKKSAKKAATPRAATSKFDPEKKITWLLKAEDGTGCREGSGRHERRLQVKKADGKTVAAFLKSGGKGTTLAGCVEDKVAKVA